MIAHGSAEEATRYICDPLDPDASDKGCGKCDADFFAYVAERERRLSLVTIHRRESTLLGPDFCRDCSEAISDWVPWPCTGGAA